MTPQALSREVIAQIYKIEEELEAAHHALSHAVRGWARVGAQQGMNDRARVKIGLLINETGQLEVLGFGKDEEDLAKVGDAARAAIKRIEDDGRINDESCCY